MPWNRNDQVKQLLSWHGHDKGGVQVPFQPGGSPLGATIETNLISKLRGLARSIADGGADTPRWIFLVGGPGNGKSEAIQDFLLHLDSNLGMQGALVQFMTDAFTPRGIVRRKVEVTSTDVAHAPGAFSSQVEHLVVVQDATATENALGNAAEDLAYEIAELFTGGDRFFIACVNRGLLARALKQAYKDWGSTSEVTQLLVDLIKATSLGTEALSNPANRLTCWPLHSDTRVACWPLDFESLLVPHGTIAAPLEQVLSSATRLPAWEVPGRCADCDARNLCPLRQNAAWLREQTSRGTLVSTLRRGELFTGQRWNFRDLFSLVAELIVGQWSDFGGATHPCEWVHSRSKEISNPAPMNNSAKPAYLLLQRLYPHALFPVNWLQPAAEKYTETTASLATSDAQPVSKEVVGLLASNVDGSSKSIRETLIRDYSKLDPATFTPARPSHPLRLIEDEYSQSLALGNSNNTRTASMAEVERVFLACLQTAEDEWNLMGRDATQVSLFVFLLRRAACLIAKRSIGVRLGHHAYEDYLAEYQEALYDLNRLNQVRDALQLMLGSSGFNFNIVESFGQPRAEVRMLAELESNRPGTRVYTAPTGTDQVPAHDVPSFEIGTSGRMPITFDFYYALRLQKEGCATSSWPATVRASIDRVRHRYAGGLSKDREKFVERTASLNITTPSANFKLELADENAEPTTTQV